MRKNETVGRERNLVGGRNLQIIKLLSHLDFREIIIFQERLDRNLTSLGATRRDTSAVSFPSSYSDRPKSSNSGIFFRYLLIHSPNSTEVRSEAKRGVTKKMLVSSKWKQQEFKTSRQWISRFPNLGEIYVPLLVTLKRNDNGLPGIREETRNRTRFCASNVVERTESMKSRRRSGDKKNE